MPDDSQTVINPFRQEFRLELPFSTIWEGPLKNHVFAPVRRQEQC